MPNQNSIKVYIGINSKALLECPICGKTGEKDFTRYKNLNSEMKFSVKCNGHQFLINLERRRYKRIETCIPGNFMTRSGSGNMIIKNLSTYGLNLGLFSIPVIDTGEEFNVSFMLKDRQSTYIYRKVIARSVYKKYIGCEFLSVDSLSHEDRYIDLYLKGNYAIL